MGVNRYLGWVVSVPAPVTGIGGYRLPVADITGMVSAAKWQNYAEIAENKGLQALFTIPNYRINTYLTASYR